MPGKLFVQKYRQLVEEYLAGAIRENEGPSDIDKAMRYSLLAGGKRLRPLLCLAAAQAVGGEPERCLPVACGLEMIHTYSLIHDDLPAMDDDDYRRGRLTNHKVFGEAKAILAGDALLTDAFLLMLGQGGADGGALLDAVRCIAYHAGSFGMVGGQVIDIEAERGGDAVLSLDGLRKMHAAKTGALFKAAVWAGGRLGGGTPEQLSALDKYADNFGLAFQITDDILDVAGDAALMGKNTGSDAKKTKCTYVSAYGLDEAGKLAAGHIDAASEALAGLGAAAGPLRFLVNNLLKRQS